MKDREKLKRELQSQGYGGASVWGGPQRIKYYAPDGSVRESIPSHISDRNGKMYDRLILMGYSLTPPAELKPHCGGCSKWHDTIEEVKVCIKQSKAQAVKWEKKTKKDLDKSQDTEIKKLKDDIIELKGLVKQLLNKEVK